MRNVPRLALMLAAAALSGCTFGLRREAPADPPEPVAEAPYLSKMPVAQETAAEKPTAVESALVWSEKYARAVEDHAAEQQKNRQLSEEGRKLAEQNTGLKTELARAQQELQEANSLLIEVRQQNERWKADVLGYRDEMRRAHQTELEALIKVIRLLGGDLPEPKPVAGTGTGTAAPSAPPAAPEPTPEKTEGAEGESVG